jgi:hypothetical protein
VRSTSFSGAHFTLAAGGFHLTHYVLGLGDPRHHHGHLVRFRSEAGAQADRHYLARPARARAIAEARPCLRAPPLGATRQVRRILRLMDIGDA